MVFLPLLIRRFLCCDYRLLLLLLLLGLGKRRRAVVVVIVVARRRGVVVVVGVTVGTRGWLLWELKFDHLNDYYLASLLRLGGGVGGSVVVALGGFRFDNGGSME